MSAVVPAFHAAAADRVLLARLLAASGVDRRPAPPDVSYLRDLEARLFSAIGALFERASRFLGLPSWLVPALVVAALVTAALLLLRGWWLRHRRRAAGKGAQEAAVGDAADAAGGRGPAADEQAWGAASWRQELERRLAEGRVAEALRAAWWWLARSLAGEQAQATWTGRELLRWSRRDDLAPLVRRLDGMTYGPRPPVVEDVRRLAASLEAVLA